MDGKIRVLIADSDMEYSSSLVHFLSEKHINDFTVALVNSSEKLGRLLDAGYRADVLVATSYFLKSLESKIMSDLLGRFEGILLLKEGGSQGSELPKFRGYLGIVTETIKYQNAHEIVLKIIDLHSSISKMERPVSKARGSGKIGVFSPIGGSGKTFIAVLIAKYLASIKKRVLLLGFEDISSLRGYFSGMPDGCSSELFLGLKTREGEFEVKEFIWEDSVSGVSVLLPPTSVSEPCELTPDEVARIYSMQIEHFDFVVSDLGAWDSVKSFKVLQTQDLIIFPIRDDKTSELKTLSWVNFCKGFEGERFEGLLGRCVCVRMTQQEDFESYSPSEMGFSDSISFRQLHDQDVESAQVREFVSKLL